MFDYVLSAAHDHCRDAVFFEVACNQTHGLMTHWSISDDDGDVAAVFTYSLVYFGTIDFIVRFDCGSSARRRSSVMPPITPSPPAA